MSSEVFRVVQEMLDGLSSDYSVFIKCPYCEEENTCSMLVSILPKEVIVIELKYRCKKCSYEELIADKREV